MDKSMTVITTTEMHTGGEPLRIIESGYPEIEGKTVIEKRRFARDKVDNLRKCLIFEPRGHYDMYGAILVKPDMKDADLGVLFMHNEGFSTMCGHAVIALGRYAIDKGLVQEVKSPETQVNMQCPCGLVKAYVQYDGKKTGSVRFHSVPAFTFATDLEIELTGFNEKVKVDIGYGGAFYALIPAQDLGLDVRTSQTQHLVDAATAVSDAVKAQVKLHHPDNNDLAFLYGTILTDGNDMFSDQPTANVCVFATRQVDRSPCGSGVTTRLAVQHSKGLIKMGQSRTFESGTTGSKFTGQVVDVSKCGEFDAVVVQVSGKGHYTGSASFTVEEDDPLRHGFLLR